MPSGYTTVGGRPRMGIVLGSVRGSIAGQRECGKRERVGYGLSGEPDGDLLLAAGPRESGRSGRVGPPGGPLCSSPLPLVSPIPPPGGGLGRRLPGGFQN